LPITTGAHIVIGEPAVCVRGERVWSSRHWGRLDRQRARRTDGVQAIKGRGGIVIAQDQASAERFEMPASAIATGAVDQVLALDNIAPELVRAATVFSRQNLRLNGDRT
jgi:hypothetical protein